MAKVLADTAIRKKVKEILRLSNCKLLTLGEPMVMQFDLTLVFTSFRLFETDYFLATEDDMFIVTEDGLNFIDMK